MPRSIPTVVTQLIRRKLQIAFGAVLVAALLTSPAPQSAEAACPANAAGGSCGSELSGAPSQAEPASDPIGVSGAFTNGAGIGLSGLTVRLYPADDLPGSGAEFSPPLLGSTTTTAGGRWTFALPATLPASIGQYAASNGGVLNLEAVATGISNGRVLTATAYVATGISGSAATGYSNQVRADAVSASVALHPDVATAAVAIPAELPMTESAATADTNSAAAYESTPTWQANGGNPVANYRPDVVAGVDYSHAIPQDNPCTVASQVLKSTIAYTIVGESHAYYDTKASFTYSSTMSSTIGVASSVNGVNWAISGSVSEGSSIGHSTGYSAQGPYFAYQWRVPIKYDYVRHKATCIHGGTTYSYSIQADGYDVPAGGAVGEYGANVLSWDGAARYNASNPRYRGLIRPNSLYTNESGHSYTYGIAASAFGVGLNGYTSMNSNHVERIDAGGGGAEHDIWGVNGPVGGAPGVVYSF